MAIQLLVLQFQIVAAVLFVLLVRQAIRKLPKVYSYILWLLVFARLLCPVVLETSFSIVPSQEESAAWVEQALQDRSGRTGLTDLDGGQENFAPAQFGAADGAGAGGANADGGAAYKNAVGQQPAGMKDKAAAPDRDGWGIFSRFMSPEFRRIMMVLPAVWAFGVILILGYNGFALMRVRKRLQSAEQYQENIYVCEGIGAPFTLGLFRPRIYIPESLADGERDYIICHERVHIRRKDYLVKNFAFLLTALYWFNPFVWLAFYFLERDMEMSCDERVIKLMGTDIKRRYSQSLLNFAEGRGSLAVTPLTFGENSVKQRVKNVLSYKNARRWSLLLGIVILAAAGITLFTTRSGTPGSEPEDVPTGQTQRQQDVPENSGHEEYNGDLIENKADFEQLYGTAGSYDFGYDKTGYAVDFYTGILQHLMAEDDEYYKRYTDPVSAAVQLLHLGAGAGMAEYANIPISVEGFEIPWLRELQMPGEGSSAIVKYTFAADGSEVEIPMELIEGSTGIWAPAASGMTRTVYQTRQVNYGAESGEECYVQTSLYGIYRLDRNGLRCIYPHYVPSGLVWGASDDGKLYFPASSSYQDGDLDYWEDVICILDMETGEYDMETYPITEEMRKVWPLQWIGVYGGFLRLYGEDGQTCYLAQINTGTTALSSGNTWNGKAMSELDEQERNAYGANMRDYLLNHPGQLVELSNRTLSENYAYVDLDGDGRAERVSLSASPEGEYVEWPYDAYVLRAGDSVVSNWYECVYNGIWAVSLDGKEIILALYGDGPSSDPMTFLYRYEQGELQGAGFFCDDIRRCTIENGVINGTDRHDVLQTDWVKAQWRLGTNEKGQRAIELVPQDTYDFTALNDITLLRQLPVHSAPDMDAESHVMQPQTLRFVKTDASFTWIYAEAADGDSGWFQVDGLQIRELGLDYYEVFENLSFMD